MHAMPIMIGVLCCLAIAYRFYSAFLAAKVAALDDSPPARPPMTFNDGQNYHPTHKWVLFGHHFAAISRRGSADRARCWRFSSAICRAWSGSWSAFAWPARCRTCSCWPPRVRRGGRSLAEIARAEIGSLAGGTASITILFVVIIALSGLGVVVVKALGGEDIKLAAGTVFRSAGRRRGEAVERRRSTISPRLPPSTRIVYTNGSTSGSQRSVHHRQPRSERRQTSGRLAAAPADRRPITVARRASRKPCPAARGARSRSPAPCPSRCSSGCTCTSSARGTWSRRRPSARSACWRPRWPAIGFPARRSSPTSQLSRNQTILAICVYGFIASVLPVWLLLVPARLPVELPQDRHGRAAGRRR